MATPTVFTVTPQPYVIIEGGLVSNTPTIPVLDLGALETDYIDAGTIEEVQEVRATALSLSLDWIVDKCDTWLAKHAAHQCQQVNGFQS